MQDECAPVLPGATRPEERQRLEPATLARHRPRLIRAAYAMCGSREDAEDLVQETFERVLRRPRFVQRDRDMAYLMRVLRHTCGSHARAAQRRRTAPSPPEDLEWLTDARAEPERHNPAGRFAMWNPRVHCPDAAGQAVRASSASARSSSARADRP